MPYDFKQHCNYSFDFHTLLNFYRENSAIKDGKVFFNGWETQFYTTLICCISFA